MSVAIRPFQDADIPRLLEAVRESHGPGFSEWMPWCRAGYDLADATAWVERHAAQDTACGYAFAVVDQETGDFLGGTGLNRFQLDHGLANLGYWIRRSQWGRGRAVAATQAAARFGFEELALTRLEIVVPVGNVRSQRVAEKAGALYEGILRHRLRILGQTYDAHLYALLSADTAAGAGPMRFTRGG